MTAPSLRLTKLGSSPALVRVTIAVMKHHHQKDEEERSYFSYTPIISSTVEGSQVKNTTLSPRHITHYCHYPNTPISPMTPTLHPTTPPSLLGRNMEECGSVCLPVEPRTTNPGVASHTMGWGVPHLSLIKKMLSRPAYKLVLLPPPFAKRGASGKLGLFFVF